MTDNLATLGRAGRSAEGVGQAILDAYDGVVPIASWGETSFFYNPGRALARGAYFCTIKDHDGENDPASALDRPGVYRLSFGVSSGTFVRLFGPRPSRPVKSGVIEESWHVTALDQLTLHPVYARMGWVCILNPTTQTFDKLRPLLGEAQERARATFDRRRRR